MSSSRLENFSNFFVVKNLKKGYSSLSSNKLIKFLFEGTGAMIPQSQSLLSRKERFDRRPGFASSPLR